MAQDGGSTKVVTLMRRVFPEKDFGRPQPVTFQLGDLREVNTLIHIVFCWM